jgi:hypothetical protein
MKVSSLLHALTTLPMQNGHLLFINRWLGVSTGSLDMVMMIKMSTPARN